MAVENETESERTIGKRMEDHRHLSLSFKNSISTNIAVQDVDDWKDDEEGDHQTLRELRSEHSLTR